MRKARIELEVTRCRECPYWEWDPDNSSSNSDGNSVCNKVKRVIAFDYSNPEIPDWCPFTISVQEKLWGKVKY